MDLERSYDNEADIPAGLTALYSEQGGKFVLADLGITANTADADSLRQQRKDNTELSLQLGQSKAALGRLEKQFEGVDADQFAQFREQLSKIGEEEERKLMATGQIDEVVKRRTAGVLSEINSRLENKTQAYDKLHASNTKLEKLFAGMQAGIKIDSIISERGLRVVDGAKEDLADRIGKDWTVDGDGRLAPRREDMLGENGAPIEPMDYVTRELLAKRPFFFAKAQGGGAGGNQQEGRREGGKTIDHNDIHGIGQNLEAVANGKMKVTRE